MRLAEFDVPAVGDDTAEMIVFYFGMGQGGSVEANIARWASQFTAGDGGPVTPVVARPQGVVFPTTVAELEGTYVRGVGAGPGRSGATPDQSLVAAIVETPSGSLFLQLVGDREAVAASRQDFLRAVEKIRPAQDAQGA